MLLCGLAATSIYWCAKPICLEPKPSLQRSDLPPECPTTITAHGTDKLRRSSCTATLKIHLRSIFTSKAHCSGRGQPFSRERVAGNLRLKTSCCFFASTPCATGSSVSVSSSTCSLRSRNFRPLPIGGPRPEVASLDDLLTLSRAVVRRLESDNPEVRNGPGFAIRNQHLEELADRLWQRLADSTKRAAGLARGACILPGDRVSRMASIPSPLQTCSNLRWPRHRTRLCVCGAVQDASNVASPHAPPAPLDF